ncbi:hypothetical protein [Sunxiuqinia sp. sy24]|uniref:hypothetical protein n=1 Tax=Sunxiuqinia sp. sy24 TaxID=3461495 RepID=UPI00404683B6
MFAKYIKNDYPDKLKSKASTNGPKKEAVSKGPLAYKTVMAKAKKQSVIQKIASLLLRKDEEGYFLDPH